MTTADALQQKLLLSAFRMPSASTMASRTSSITNAFVSAIIPVVIPTISEIEEALKLLEMSPDDVRCVYCGDRSTQWDHLRPLVVKRKPTGYISEIANLVPSCGTCNSSKGNKDWRLWMQSGAKLSPASRGINNVEDRVRKLERYVDWRQPQCIDFENIIAHDKWTHYWHLCDEINKDLMEAQKVANELRAQVSSSVARSSRSGAPKHD